MHTRRWTPPYPFRYSCGIVAITFITYTQIWIVRMSTIMAELKDTWILYR